MSTTADFKNGLCIKHQGELFTILQFQHVKPGKGGAFVRTKLKKVSNGKVLEHTFNSGVKIATARVERRECQFLYKDSMGYHLMDQVSFESYVVEESKINAPKFLTEGAKLFLLFYSEQSEVIGCELPPLIVLTVREAPPGIQGDRVTRAYKEAWLETIDPECSISVPLFIKSGDQVKVDTRTGEYVERIQAST